MDEEVKHNTNNKRYYLFKKTKNVRPVLYISDSSDDEDYEPTFNSCNLSIISSEKN